MLDPRDRRKHAFRAAADRHAVRPADRDALPRVPADDDATGTAAPPLAPSPLAPSPIAPAEVPRVPRATLTVHRPDAADPRAAPPPRPDDDAIARRAANRRLAEAAGWTPGTTPPDGARAPLRLVDTRRIPER